MVRNGWLVPLIFVAVPTVALAQQNGPVPAIAGVFAPGTEMEVLKDTTAGDMEGPVGLDDGSILFTSGNSIMKIAPDKTISVLMPKTNGENGLSMDWKGTRLYATVTGKNPAPGIAIVWPKGQERVITKDFHGKPYIRPNDLIVDAKGGVYFSDPANRPAKAGDRLPELSSVYYVKPDGTVVLLDNRMRRPNGVQLSPDGKTLYVTDTILETIIAFDIKPDGTVENGRVWATYNGTGPEGSGGDGLAMDAEGRLYSAAINGLQVFSPKGEWLGTVPLKHQPQNLAFGGPGKSWLYIVGRGGIVRIKTLTPGVKGRVK